MSQKETRKLTGVRFVKRKGLLTEKDGGGFFYKEFGVVRYASTLATLANTIQRLAPRLHLH